jgi:hypothetical protein
MEVSSEFHAPTTLPPGKEHPQTQWTGGQVGPRASLDAVAKRKKSYFCQESNPSCPAKSLVTILIELPGLYGLRHGKVKYES